MSAVLTGYVDAVEAYRKRFDEHDECLRAASDHSSVLAVLKACAEHARTHAPKAGGKAPPLFAAQTTVSEGAIMTQRANTTLTLICFPSVGQSNANAVIQSTLHAIETCSKPVAVFMNATAASLLHKQAVAKRPQRSANAGLLVCVCDPSMLPSAHRAPLDAMQLPVFAPMPSAQARNGVCAALIERLAFCSTVGTICVDLAVSPVDEHCWPADWHGVKVVATRFQILAHERNIADATHRVLLCSQSVAPSYAHQACSSAIIGSLRSSPKDHSVPGSLEQFAKLTFEAEMQLASTQTNADVWRALAVRNRKQVLVVDTVAFSMIMSEHIANRARGADALKSNWDALAKQPVQFTLRFMVDSALETQTQQALKSPAYLWHLTTGLASAVSTGALFKPPSSVASSVHAAPARSIHAAPPRSIHPSPVRRPATADMHRGNQPAVAVRPTASIQQPSRLASGRTRLRELRQTFARKIAARIKGNTLR